MKTLPGFVEIPQTTFTIGDAELHERWGDCPPTEVTVPAFQMSEACVTVGEYKHYCQVTGKEAPTLPEGFNNDDHPMVNITWDEANAYCAWKTEELRKQGVLAADESIQLPTEAQWECAATCGGKQRYATKSGELTKEEARYDTDRTGPVKEFLPNPWGLYGMTGNVWEWCADVYDKDAYRKLKESEGRYMACLAFWETKDGKTRITDHAVWRTTEDD